MAAYRLINDDEGRELLKGIPEALIDNAIEEAVKQAAPVLK
jgi:hypothetical protein